MKEKKKTKQEKKGLKIFGKIILTLLIILVVLISIILGYAYNKLSKIQKVEINVGELNIDTNVEQKLSGYRNIVLFGIDSRSTDDYAEGNRSDCIIIASINNDTKEVKLVSVYRDTYMQIKGYGLDKVTHAYSYGEAPLAINTLNTNLDLNIKEFVTVNFEAVAEAINELGGVKINIDSEEAKIINGYIDETSKVTGIKSKHITSAGTQTLDGIQAVAYGRIRYTSGGDYKRTERMRTVVEAMVNQLKTKNISEINSFINKILPKVYTNISATEMISLVPTLIDYKITESIGWPYETKGITLDRWYGVPVNLANNVTKLHQELFGEADYKPSQTVQDISAKIIKKTGYK